MRKIENPEISIILPCRNEEEALGKCIREVRKALTKAKIKGEIIVSDSSSDKSPEIARKEKVRLVKHDLEGYGNAYLEGLKVAKGKYVFMADADGSYEFSEIPRFLSLLKKGNDIVLGNRFLGEMDKKAMPALHKYVGNPLLSGIFRFLFRSKIRDVHSGIRGARRDFLNKLNLQTRGMEFASEMLIKATRAQGKIVEVPVNYRERKGESKLRSFSDGWRHLRFMLLYNPILLFFIPGAILLFLGLESLIFLYFFDLKLLGITLVSHPMFISSLFVILGYQLIIFSIFSKSYSIIYLGESPGFMSKIYDWFRLERSIFIGTLLGILGLIIYILILYNWINSGYGFLNEVKNSILALTLITLGVQTIFSAFMLSILGIKGK